jgi:hypothetical protein
MMGDLTLTYFPIHMSSLFVLVLWKIEWDMKENPCNLVGTWLKGIDKLRTIGIFGFITPLLLVGI